MHPAWASDAASERTSSPDGAAPTRGGGWRAVVYRWFVEYNPLYFASALCVLAGVFLVARELPPDAFGSKLAVAAGTEAYQLLLLAGAVVLLRAGLKRPAAILGITAFVFLLDVAFNGERLMSFVGLMSLEPGMRARRAIPASLVFALLGPIKLCLLAYVFRLRSARPALAVAGTVVLLLPLLPYAIELESTLVSVRQSIYMVLSWLGAPVLLWAFSPAARRWTSQWTEDNPDPWLTRRIAFIAPFLVAGLYGAHVLGWRSLSDLSLSPAQVAPYVLAATVAVVYPLAGRLPGRAEFVAWIGAGVTLWAAGFSPHSTGLWPLAVVSMLTGYAFLILLETTPLRLFLPAAVCLFGGAYILASGPFASLPAPDAVWTGGLAAALLAGAIRQRDFRCLFVSALACGATVARIPPVPPAYGGIAAGLWLAVASALLFRELRWVPLASIVGVLALGSWMTWHDMPGIVMCYSLMSATSFGVGLATRRTDFQGTGLASATVMAGLKHGAWIPATSKGWGIALLAAGFLFLSAGVAVNLLLARRRSQAGG